MSSDNSYLRPPQRKPMVDPGSISATGVMLKLARELTDLTRDMRLMLFGHKFIESQNTFCNPYVPESKSVGTDVTLSEEQRKLAEAWFDGYMTGRSVSEAICETYKDLLPTISTEEQLLWSGELTERVQERLQEIQKYRRPR